MDKQAPLKRPINIGSTLLLLLLNCFIYFGFFLSYFGDGSPLFRGSAFIWFSIGFFLPPAGFVAILMRSYKVAFVLYAVGLLLPLFLEINFRLEDAQKRQRHINSNIYWNNGFLDKALVKAPCGNGAMAVIAMEADYSTRLEKAVLVVIPADKKDSLERLTPYMKERAYNESRSEPTVKEFKDAYKTDCGNDRFPDLPSLAAHVMALNAKKLKTLIPLNQEPSPNP